MSHCMMRNQLLHQKSELSQSLMIVFKEANKKKRNSIKVNLDA